MNDHQGLMTIWICPDIILSIQTKAIMGIFNGTLIFILLNKNTKNFFKKYIDMLNSGCYTNWFKEKI